MNDEILGLIQLEVDGENTPADSRRLASLCSTDPAVQLELDRYLEMAQLVNGIVPRNPSPTFADQVMAALPAQPSWQKKPQTAPFWTRLFSLPKRPVYAMSYGLALGAIIMFAFSIGFQADSPAGPTGLTATMAPSSTPLFSEKITTSQGEVISIDAIEVNDVVQLQIAGINDAQINISLKIEDEAGIRFDRSIPISKN